MTEKVTSGIIVLFLAVFGCGDSTTARKASPDAAKNIQPLETPTTNIIDQVSTQDTPANGNNQPVVVDNYTALGGRPTSSNASGTTVPSPTSGSGATNTGLQNQTQRDVAQTPVPDPLSYAQGSERPSLRNNFGNILRYAAVGAIGIGAVVMIKKLLAQANLKRELAHMTDPPSSGSVNRLADLLKNIGRKEKTVKPVKPVNDPVPEEQPPPVKPAPVKPVPEKPAPVKPGPGEPPPSPGADKDEDEELVKARKDKDIERLTAERDFAIKGCEENASALAAQRQVAGSIGDGAGTTTPVKPDEKTLSERDKAYERYKTNCAKNPSPKNPSRNCKYLDDRTGWDKKYDQAANMREAKAMRQDLANKNWNKDKVDGYMQYKAGGGKYTPEQWASHQYRARLFKNYGDNHGGNPPLTKSEWVQKLNAPPTRDESRAGLVEGTDQFRQWREYKMEHFGKPSADRLDPRQWLDGLNNQAPTVTP